MIIQFMNICITFIIVYYNQLVFFPLFVDWKMVGVDSLFEVGDNQTVDTLVTAEQFVDNQIVIVFFVDNQVAVLVVDNQVFALLVVDTLVLV